MAKEMIEEIRAKVKELLETKKVELVFGYKRAADGILAAPVFVEKLEDVDALIWDQYCVYNLSNYFKDFSGKKAGIIAGSCDIKSIMVLVQENQLKRENVFIIGVEGEGQIMPPASCDYIIKHKEPRAAIEKSGADPYDTIGKFKGKSLEERLKFWQKEFSRCIRCYACRQICPMCYCPRCVADQNSPAWFSKATELEGNFSWNIVRAMHLAGRCIGCGECQRACPVGIPLREINRKIEKDIKEAFHYEAGTDSQQKPLLGDFDKNDPDEWIK